MTKTTEPRYYRSAPIMAYPDGRLLRWYADTLDVWEQQHWRATSEAAPPTHATEIPAEHAQVLTGEHKGDSG